MAKKSDSGGIFSMALLAVGGYLVYSNWAGINSWFQSLLTSTAAAAAAPTTSSAYYPNSPVPIGTSTSQLFVDSAGNEWAFSTQTNQWVIAVPAPSTPSTGATLVPAPSTLPAGTLVSTTPAPALPVSSGTVVAAAPAAAQPVVESTWGLAPNSPGTVVATSQTPPDGVGPEPSVPVYAGHSFGPIIVMPNGRRIIA